LKSLILNQTNVENLFSQRKKKKREWIDDNPYVYDCTNENGDVVSHYFLEKRKPKSYNLSGSFDINEFLIKFNILKHPNCYLLFPPTQKNIYSRHAKYFDIIENQIKKNNVKIVNPIIENVYDESAFFDAEYHLTRVSNIKRTRKIIGFLNELDI